MHSMTGFGRGEAADEHYAIVAEASSINRKQLDVQISLPRTLAELEAGLRKSIIDRVSRGRVQVSFTIDRVAGNESVIDVDLDAAVAFETAFAKLSEKLGRTVQMTAADFLQRPNVFSHGSADYTAEEISGLLEHALSAAIDDLVKSRATEGAALRSDFQLRLKTLAGLRAELGQLAPAVVDSYRAHLTKRLDDIGLEVDLGDDRIVREIALFAERSDISEELTRLDAHLARFHELADSDEPSGRPLDFLCQEINREFNTIGSKAHSSEITARVVAAKTELEKVREQVQNVE